MHARVADMGNVFSLETGSHLDRPSFFAASRLGSVNTPRKGVTLWIQLTGIAWICSEQGRLALQAYEWIVPPPGSALSIQTDRRSLGVGLWLPDRVAQSAGKHDMRPIYAGQGHCGRHFARTFSRAWYRAERLSRKWLDATILDAVLRPVLYQIADLQEPYQHLVERCPGQSMTRKRQAFQRMQMACFHMAGNANRVVHVPELSQLCQMSDSYFSKMFKTIYGEGAQIVGVRFRLRSGAIALANSEATISEISDSLGFDSSCSFTRTFKSQFGLTPSEYRSLTQRSQNRQTIFALPPYYIDSRCMHVHNTQLGSTRASLRMVSTG